MRTGKTGRSSTRAQPVGRIYEDALASTAAELRWFWSITVYVWPDASIVTSGRAPTLDQAKAEFAGLAFHTFGASPGENDSQSGGASFPADPLATWATFQHGRVARFYLRFGRAACDSEMPRWLG